MHLSLVIVIVAAAASAGALAILMYALLRAKDDVTVRDRLESLGAGNKPTVYALEQLELSTPFVERTIKPMLNRLSRLATKLSPGSKADSVGRKLAMAGHPGSMTVEIFLGLKIVGSLVIAAIVFLVLVTLEDQGPLMDLVYTAVGGVVGFYAPELWLRDRIGQRKKVIQKALPDTLDVLTISVEAGLGFDAAIGRICEKTSNPLTAELERYLTEMRLGKARRDALRMIQARTGVDDLNAFISAIIQADQLGVSMAKILRVQSEQIRIKRRQRAEQLAQQAPLKMLFPMILFIFPSIFVVILGPSIQTIQAAFVS